MIWDFFTWLAIGALIVVSIAVFVWFLADIRRIYGRSPDR